MGDWPLPLGPHVDPEDEPGFLDFLAFVLVVWGAGALAGLLLGFALYPDAAVDLWRWVR